jgi:hypothetical protein
MCGNIDEVKARHAAGEKKEAEKKTEKAPEKKAEKKAAKG